MQWYFNWQLYLFIPLDYEYLFEKPFYANLTIYEGAEGITTPIAMPHNAKYVYPLTRETHMHANITMELQDFL